MPVMAGLLRLKQNGLPAAGNSAVEIALLAQHSGQAQTGPGVVGPDLQRQLVEKDGSDLVTACGKCIAKLQAEVGIDGPQIDSLTVDIGVVGTERVGAAIPVLRLPLQRQRLPLQGTGQIAGGVWQLRLQRERLAKAGGGILPLLQPGVTLTQVEMGTGEMGIEIDGLAIGRDSLRPLPLHHQDIANIVMRPGEPR